MAKSGAIALLGILALVFALVLVASCGGDDDEPELPDQVVIAGKEFADMTKDEYETRLRQSTLSEEAIQRSLSTFESEQQEARRWQEQWTHSDYLNAIDASIEAIREDRVTS